MLERGPADMQSLTSQLDASKRSDRRSERFIFIFTLDTIVGLPARHGCSSVLVRMTRGAKTLTSEEIDLPSGYRGLPQVRWPSGCQLELVRIHSQFCNNSAHFTDGLICRMQPKSLLNVFPAALSVDHLLRPQIQSALIRPSSRVWRNALR